MKVVKIVVLVIVFLGLTGLSGFLFYKNTELNASYKDVTAKVTQLQSQLDAIGTFSDVYTVRSNVKCGQQITESDLTLQTIPTSSVPSNVVKDPSNLIGNYFRIDMSPGITLTTDLIMVEEYVGATYIRDLHFDQLPVGTEVGDYVDVRVVLPGGEEYVVLEHKRVNDKWDNTVQMKFDEADLWLYTSMKVDEALYGDVGFKVYCTKYTDPGAHDEVLNYYPVRAEVVDIMNINPNMTDSQRARIWNESVRKSIDAKLAVYADQTNTSGPTIAAGWGEEVSASNTAQQFIEQAEQLAQNGNSSGLQNPNDTDSSSGSLSDDLQNQTNESLGQLGDDMDAIGDITGTDAPTTDGHTDSLGSGSTIPQGDIMDAQGDNLFDDETPIS